MDIVDEARRPSRAVLNLHSTLVAADGDEVHLTYAGAVLLVSQTETLAATTVQVDGCTGRFAKPTDELATECLIQLTSRLGGFLRAGTSE